MNNELIQEIILLLEKVFADKRTEVKLRLEIKKTLNKIQQAYIDFIEEWVYSMVVESKKQIRT